MLYLIVRIYSWRHRVSFTYLNSTFDCCGLRHKSWMMNAYSLPNVLIFTWNLSARVIWIFCPEAFCLLCWIRQIEIMVGTKNTWEGSVKTIWMTDETNLIITQFLLGFVCLFFSAFLKLYVLLCFMCNTPSLTIQLMNPKMGLVSAFEICLFSHWCQDSSSVPCYSC